MSEHDCLFDEIKLALVARHALTERLPRHGEGKELLRSNIMAIKAVPLPVCMVQEFDALECADNLSKGVLRSLLQTLEVMSDDGGDDDVQINWMLQVAIKLALELPNDSGRRNLAQEAHQQEQRKKNLKRPLGKSGMGTRSQPGWS